MENPQEIAEADLVRRRRLAGDRLILSFSEDYRWLSNFWVAPIELTAFGERWTMNSTEHVFQMAKLEHTELTREHQRELFEEVAGLETPGQSKRFGRRVPALDVASWNRSRDRAMATVLRAKFTQHEGLRGKLLELEGYFLEEGNHWGDRYWGVDGTGQNRLGQLLMVLRDRWLARQSAHENWQPTPFIPEYFYPRPGEGATSK